MANETLCNNANFQLSDEEWIKDHIVYNEAFTQELLEELGRWDSAEYLRSTTQWVGTGYQTHFYRLTIGGRVYEAWYKVTGPGRYMSSWTEIDLAQEEADRKEYGRKVSRLAQAAGVPWRLASLLASKEDSDREKNLAALEKAKEIRRSRLDKKTLHELVECGISRRSDAISNLLGDLKEQFNYSGQIKSQRMADYLAGYRI